MTTSIRSSLALRPLWIAVLLAGCAGNATPGTTPATANSVPNLALTGIPSQYWPLMAKRRPSNRMRSHASAYPPDLYVADDVGLTPVGSVDVLSRTKYYELGDITNGVNFPLNVSLDARGNLYVVNTGTANVTEYAPNATSPTFTYSTAIMAPLDAVADSHGSVYEADYGRDAVTEFAQGNDSVIATCQPGGHVYGVAVDSKNDVFVDYYGAGGLGYLAEYAGGLHGCNATAFSLTFSGPGGLVLDKNNDLIVCDPGSASVDVVPPPYNGVGRTIGSGFAFPYHVRLNRKNSLAFVADPLNATVTVVNYQTGANVTVLGAPYGLIQPYAAVEQPNAVY